MKLSDYEKETILEAQKTLSLMSQGINPLTKKHYRGNSILDANIIRALFVGTCAIEEHLKHIGVKPKNTKKKIDSPDEKLRNNFFNNQSKEIVDALPQSISLGKFVIQISSICLKNVGVKAKLMGRNKQGVIQLLCEDGYIQCSFNEEIKNNTYTPTQKGLFVGFEPSTYHLGELNKDFPLTLLNKKGQEFVIDFINFKIKQGLL